MAIDKTKFTHNGGNVISQIKIGTGDALPIHDPEVDALVTELEKVDNTATGAATAASNAQQAAEAADKKAGDAATAASNAKTAADNAQKAAEAAQATATEAKGTADQNKKDLGTLQATVESIQGQVTSNKLTVSDAKSGTQFVTNIKETDGVISTEKATITAAMVTTSTNTNVESWLTQLDAALEEIVGEDSDTITSLKALYDEIMSGEGADLTGTIIDWVAAAKKTGATDLVQYVSNRIADLATKTEVNNAKTELKGTYASATASDETVAGAKKYADDKASTAKSEAIAAAKEAAVNEVKGLDYATKTDVNNAKTELKGTYASATANDETVAGAKKYADSLAGNYAPKVHNHDDVYAKLVHAHTDYSAKTHTHTITNGGWNITAANGILTFTQTNLTTGAASA